MIFIAEHLSRKKRKKLEKHTHQQKKGKKQVSPCKRFIGI